ncbi:MAG TPA: molybdopterin cofactor-binding domain-containing protein [Thermoanaerobaculia bacterium]|nr:molybdopterin cofactor-binding domain-containing protein [Thermoanaerobaculia bacterium]
MTDDALELAQHEVDGLHVFDSDRRTFLKTLGGGILVCLSVPRVLAQESGRGGFFRDLPQDVASWLHVGEDGRVTAFTGKVEFGQNIRTSLAQQVAEELHVDVSAIDLVMGDTDRCPWDAGTFGSRTTPTMGPQLRRMAAIARGLLVDLAARRWNADSARLAAEKGRVRNPDTGASLSYGELSKGQNLVKTSTADVPLTPAADWKVMGKPAAKVNGRDFVTGRHVYTSDLTRPGLLHGLVVRRPSFKATLASVDKAAAERLPGVTVVRDGDFLGIAAADRETAARAAAALETKWNEVPGQPSNATIFEFLRKNATPGEQGTVKGSVEEAMASADVKLEKTYTVEYIAHVPLETRTAVAEWAGDKLTVWTGSQRPFAVKEELAEAFHIPADKVRVLVPDTGSGYGGKHAGDAAVEAARLAKAAGKPVKVSWSREEEFTWAYVRPAGVIDVKSGARRDGTLTAWEFHNINSGPAAIGTPYAVANQRIQFHPVPSPLRQGSYRGLAATANHFARETYMDELAHALALDPLAFRLKNLSDARLKAVFEAAAEKFSWGKEKPTRERGSGVAGGTEKGGYLATCAEVEIDPKTRRVRIRRVVAAFECGAVVNPNGLRNQIEGAIVQSIGGAMFEAVRFENGRILSSRLSQYRVPRFADVPEIEIVILDRKDLPSAGAGETPIVGLAPAVGNAIFATTKVRLRALPLVPQGLPG